METNTSIVELNTHELTQFTGGQYFKPSIDGSFLTELVEPVAKLTPASQENVLPSVGVKKCCCCCKAG